MSTRPPGVQRLRNAAEAPNPDGAPADVSIGKRCCAPVVSDWQQNTQPVPPTANQTAR